MIKLHLYKPNSWIGYGICIVTFSKYCHAAIEYKGKLYDASESRGRFGKASLHTINRPSSQHLISVDDDTIIDGWLSRNMNRKYDYKGVIGWIFKVNDHNRFYCFEALYDILLTVKVIEKPMPKRVSARTLISVLGDYYKRNY
jgi:hypothetical protein|tara:strand:+ start:1446 stop:1874 length:429 start_codon:yes stop_codon:yes gene_type:complete